MLKNRVLTALVLACVILPGVWFLPPLWFAVVFGVVIALAGWEWAGLAGLATAPTRAGFVLVLAAWMLTGPQWAEYALDWLAWPVVVWWFVIGFLLRRVPGKLLALHYPVAVKLPIGFFVLLTAWILMVWLRVNFGVAQVLYLLLLVWAADIAAYFVGKRFGVTKLAPEISPGKTVEGLYGALAAALAMALAVSLYLEFEAIKTLDFAMLSIVTVLFSVTGDLFESLLKRVRGVKDSGDLLPGHGGLLDRIDSLLAAISVFYAGSLFLEIFLGSIEGTVVVPPEQMGSFEPSRVLAVAAAFVQSGFGLLENVL
jgi:phosphatidate cytidylyltransferase